MTSLKSLSFLLLFCFAAILFSACSRNDDPMSKMDFDRKAMLENWYDNIIIPSFTEFNYDLEVLALKANSFSESHDSSHFKELKSDFLKAWKSFQAVKLFEFGPSANLNFRSSLNSYPSDTLKIKNNFNSNPNLGGANMLNAKGFPAIDYLLFNRLSKNLEDTAAIAYLKLIIADLEVLTQDVNQLWLNHRSDFINASGTDIGSSTGMAVNAMNKDFELLKNAKIGFPSGKRTFGQTFPEACEAYYSLYSKELSLANIEAIYRFWQGLSPDNSTKGPSLEDYIIELEVMSLGENLDVLIHNQFTEAIQNLNALPASLEQSVNDYPKEVDDVYLAIQNNIIYLKTDMPSAFGVLITYQDNDGD